MPLTREEHEALLNELNSSELAHTRRTEILQNLRVDYGSVIDEHSEHTTKLKQLAEENADLTVANSKLFRQGGFTKDDDKNDDDKKEFSQTVTLTELLKE